MRPLQPALQQPSRAGEHAAARVALIGGSGYAETLLNSLLPCLEMAQARLVAATLAGQDAYSKTSARLATQPCEIFSDYRAMLRSLRGRIDLCVIPTSIHWHTRMSVEAMEAGANVLVEKPLAGSLADALKITETSRRTGKFVAVGFQDMFSPATRSIKEFLCTAGIGSVLHIHVSGSWPRNPAYYLRNDWAGKKFLDGWAVWDSPLNNAFAHFLNLALYFAGLGPQAIALVEECSGRLLRHYPIETFDTASVKFRSSDGVEIQCDVTHLDPETVDPRLTISGEKGTLVWDFEKQAVALDSGGGVIRSWLLDSAEASRRAMLGNILNCLHHGENPLFTADDALAHLASLDLLVKNIPVQNARFLPSQRGLFVSLLGETASTGH